MARDKYIEHEIGIPEGPKGLDPEGLDLDENEALIVAGLLTVKQVQSLVTMLKDEALMSVGRNFLDVKKDVIDVLARESRIKNYAKRGKDGKSIRDRIFSLLGIFEKKRKEPLVLGKTAEKTTATPETAEVLKDEDSPPPPEAPPAVLSFEERIRAQTALEIERIQNQMRQGFEGSEEDESGELAHAEWIVKELGAFTAELAEAEITQNEIKKMGSEMNKEIAKRQTAEASIAALEADIIVEQKRLLVASKRIEMAEIAKKIKATIAELESSLSTAQGAKIKANEVVNQHCATIQEKMQQQGERIRSLQTSANAFQEKNGAQVQGAWQTAVHEQQKVKDDLAVFTQDRLHTEQSKAHEQTFSEAQSIMKRIADGYAVKAQSWKKMEGAMSDFSEIVNGKVKEYENLLNFVSPLITAEVENSEEVSEEDDSSRTVAHEESDLKNAEIPEAIGTVDPVIEKLNEMAIPTEIPPVKIVETNEDLMKFVQTQQERMNEMQPPPVGGERENIVETKKEEGIAILHSEEYFGKLFQKVKIDPQIMATENRAWEVIKAAGTIYDAFNKIDKLEDLINGTRRDFKTEFQLDKNGQIVFKAFFDGETQYNRDELTITFLENDNLEVETRLSDDFFRTPSEVINKSELVENIKNSQVFQPEEAHAKVA